MGVLTWVSFNLRTDNIVIFTSLDNKASIRASVDELYRGDRGKRCPLEMAFREGMVGWRVSLRQKMLALGMTITASGLVKGGVIGRGGSVGEWTSW